MAPRLELASRCPTCVSMHLGTGSAWRRRAASVASKHVSSSSMEKELKEGGPARLPSLPSRHWKGGQQAQSLKSSQACPSRIGRRGHFWAAVQAPPPSNPTPTPAQAVHLAPHELVLRAREAQLALRHLHADAGGLQLVVGGLGGEGGVGREGWARAGRGGRPTLVTGTWPQPPQPACMRVGRACV